MNRRPDLTITIVSWNTRELLAACLRTIASGAGSTSYEVHVVDNASADGSAEMVAREFPEVRVSANDENLGFARANNQSWREATGRYWLLLNSDTEVRPGALRALVDFMDARPRVGLASARLVGVDGRPQHCAQPSPSVARTLAEAMRLHKLLPGPVRARTFLGPYWTYDASVEVGWTWGTALIARREAVERVGPLSDAYFMYGEDLEWCLRARAAGWQIWFCAESEVLHYGGQSSAKQWDDAAKLKITMDGIYRAIGEHRGRLYVAALHAATLAALSVERAVGRLRGRPSASAGALAAYHALALRETFSARPFAAAAPKRDFARIRSNQSD